MNKRQFYKMLAKKYDLPLEYIRFTVDPIYHMERKQKAVYRRIKRYRERYKMELCPGRF